MNKRIINLAEAAKARGRELPQPLPDVEEFDLLGNPEGIFSFPLDDFVQDREGRPLFVSPQKLERAKNVFARWGLDMQDYSESTDTFLAAWYALAGTSNTERSLMVGKHLTYGAAQEAYLWAVHEGDHALAAKLFPSSDTARYVQAEISNDLLASKVAKRPQRPGARENSVVAFLLDQPVSRGAAVTVGQAFEEMFERSRNNPKPMCTGIFEAFSKAHGEKAIKGLWNQGLAIYTAWGCPVPDEVSVIFRRDAFEARMDRSRLKKEWRALLGPFVGIDQNWRLLMDADMRYFEAANPRLEFEWKPRGKEANTGELLKAVAAQNATGEQNTSNKVVMSDHKVINFLEAAKTRGIVLPVSGPGAQAKAIKGSPKSSARSKAPAELDSGDELTVDLENLLVDEDTGEVLFISAEAEAAANAVFARWGLRMSDHTSSFDEFTGVWQALFVGCAGKLDYWYRHSIMESRPAEAPQLKYLEAVSAGNRLLAAKLFPKTSYAKDVLDQVTLNKLERKAKQTRTTRTDARKNEVVAYLLAQMLAPAQGVRIGDALEELFVVCRAGATTSVSTCCAWMSKHGDTTDSKLRNKGLSVQITCPLGEETSVLFHLENLAKLMDRSRLKGEWRALLGPFAGFDQNWGLLMRKDLEFFEAGYLQQFPRAFWLEDEATSAPTPAGPGKVRALNPE